MTGRVAGVVLTGGAARRLGRPKATLLLHGEPLGVRAARVLGAVCDPVVEVGPGVTGLRHVREDPPGGGPLCALAAADAVLPPGVPFVALACDMPNVSAALVELLASWPGTGTVVPVAGGRLQTLCARYGVDARAELVGTLTAGGRALRDLLARVAAVELDEARWHAVAGAEAFADIDTPEDAARWGIEGPG